MSHINPDGDAIGSVLGFNHYLSSTKKNCKMILPDSMPEFFHWMESSENVLTFRDKPDEVKKAIKECDLIILLDFNEISRINALATLVLDSGKNTILIDHHPGPDIKADLIISEPSISSTAEIVFELILQIEGKPFLDKSFCEAIYVGMMTDTGNFNFGSYDGDTLRLVALMIDSGLDKEGISDKVYNTFSENRIRMKGYSLNEKMVVLPGYSSAYISLTRDEMNRFSHSIGDTEGFVNMPLSIRNVFFAVLFIERATHIKISFRSKGNFSVNDFASKYFSGGGHTNAAGGRYVGSLASCISYFEELLPGQKELIKLASE
jgi:phosphoesterase RecJ-like protein